MKNALILHGAGNNSSGNWFPWLKTELEKKGYKVWVPDLPNADNPRIEEWLETVDKGKFEFNEESLLVGHSCGGTLILRILENLPEGTKVGKVVLVAAPLDKGNVPEYWPLKEYLAYGTFDWNKIKKSVKEMVLVYSDNDPYDCGVRHGEVIAKNTGAKLILKKGQGHFNLVASENYREFPELLDLI